MRTQALSKATLIALAAVVALASAACNTVAGAGRDVSNAGDAVSEAANDTADEIQNNNPN